MRNSLAKADLHLHSKASNLPGGWFSKLIGCPESFTEPMEIYKRLKERGMTYITITDHNTIDGVLEIAHLPEVFISCEYTVEFPEEKAKVHVLAYGIDERIHQDLIKLRENVYEFVSYLKAKNIAHSLAHPLYSVQDTKITKSLVEKFVLLFDNWEVINGTRGENLRELEEKLARLYEGWDKVHQLEEKYKIKSLRTRPYISFTAGSDDHGGMDVGKTWTEAQALSKEEFLQALREGRTAVNTEKLGYERLLNMVSRVGYDFLLNKGKIPSALKPFTDFIFMHSNNPMTELFLRTFLGTNAERHSLLKEALDKVPKLALERFLKEPSTSTLGESILALALHSAPAFLAYGQKIEEKKVEEVVKGFGITPKRKERLAYITDTHFEINGVARSSRIIRELAQRYDLPLDVITVWSGDVKEKYLVLLKPAFEFSTPFYEEFKLRVPTLISLLDLLRNYSRVHIATPGPLGIMAFGVAKALGLPTTFTFHTDVPAYAYTYTGSPELMDISYKLIALLCNACEKVFTPSEAYKKLLKEKGVREEKIRVFKRGVDTNLFNPSKKVEGFFQRKFGVQVRGNVILYVGRVSKEKNLDAFLYCAKSFPEDTFIIVGDGPYREEVEKKKPRNVYLLGYLTGEDLAKAYASADVFLFPSETETYGQVILEAMASGLPLVVSGKGASHEHVEEGVNGFIAHSYEDFAEKLGRLLESPRLREFMSAEALRYAQSMDLTETYLDYINKLLGRIGVKV
jgi:glycosyltransferase involved in cell wall biosynthesis